MSWVVAIVGRPNVGKSTLFNRICGGRDAVVAEESGVTRDRNSRIAEWCGHGFLAVDTGGIVPFGETNRFDEDVSAIAREAIDTSDAIVFVVDVRSGITAEDEKLVRELRGLDKPVFLAVNKAERKQDISDAADFHRLGLDRVYSMSALHGDGVAELLDDLVAALPKRPPIDEDPADLKVALVGRPNVGKSSLLNAIVGERRALVSEVAGTTRDTVDTDLNWQKRKIRLVDTAGLRRKGRHDKGVEYFSILRTLQAVARCDVAVLLIDAEQGIVAQDARVAGEIHEKGRGCVIAVNKWDMIQKDTHTAKRFEEELRRELAFLSYAPVITISALEGQRVGRVLEMAWEVGKAQRKKVETSRLNDILAKAMRRNPPKAHQGRLGKVYYATQTASAPPTFTLFVNQPSNFVRHYLRYLNNQIRAAVGFTGTRIHVDLRKRQ
jgi:GTPase